MKHLLFASFLAVTSCGPDTGQDNPIEPTSSQSPNFCESSLSGYFEEPSTSDEDAVARVDQLLGNSWNWSEKTWPGFTFDGMPLIVHFSSGKAALFNGERLSPEERGGRRIEFSSDRLAYWIEDTNLEFRRTFYGSQFIGEVEVYVFGFDIFRPTFQALSILVHEFFHHYQWKNFPQAFYSNIPEVFRYALNSKNLSLVILENHLLRNLEITEEFFQNLAATVTIRREKMSDGAKNHEEDGVVFEGTAQYTSYPFFMYSGVNPKIQPAAGVCRSFYAGTAGEYIGFDDGLAGVPYNRNYGLGAAMALGIDHHDSVSDWKKELETGKDLSEIFLDRYKITKAEAQRRVASLITAYGPMELEQDSLEMLVSFKAKSDRLLSEYRKRNRIEVILNRTDERGCRFGYQSRGGRFYTESGEVIHRSALGQVACDSNQLKGYIEFKGVDLAFLGSERHRIAVTQKSKQQLIDCLESRLTPCKVNLNPGTLTVNFTKGTPEQTGSGEDLELAF